MNTTVRLLALAVAFSVPALSFAQSSNKPATRAEVRSELFQLQSAGYKPNKVKYPADIQAAEARTAARMQSENVASRAVGGSANGSAQSGHAHRANSWKSMYSHH
ncbi:DUF4148 domain-containing protein [Caballeronia concitans]|uniref:Purine nucleoside phosphorylase n=1 Tax=Caballeronia concitans TaxID=1777133 RepID=A0A658R657_9BURK|nr:DUF4148 domain-containing protein [Caballeronia concitans]SAL52268.1 purine nucleoside phosphorylase [Caballeronia concitans]